MPFVEINTEGTSRFVSTCREASQEAEEIITRAKRSRSWLRLDAEPVVEIDWTDAVGAADDYGDMSFIAEQLRLDAIGADSIDIGHYEPANSDRSLLDLGGRTVDVLLTTENMANDGIAGAKARDARNAKVTVAALHAALRAGADVEVTDEGLIVAQTDGIDLGALKATSPAAAIIDTIPLSARGGTTYGNVFITGKDTIEFDEYDAPVDVNDKAHPKRDESVYFAELLDHETRHTYQWAAAGAGEYAALYLSYEAAREVGNQLIRPGPNFEGWQPPDIGGWKPPRLFRTPKIPFTPDEIKPGCNNPFEMDADWEDGHYDCPAP